MLTESKAAAANRAIAAYDRYIVTFSSPWDPLRADELAQAAADACMAAAKDSTESEYIRADYRLKAAQMRSCVLTR